MVTNHIRQYLLSVKQEGKKRTAVEVHRDSSLHRHPACGGLAYLIMSISCKFAR